MKNSIRPRETNITCALCGVVISSKSSGAGKRICLICYARQLNEHFRKSRVPVATEKQIKLT